MWNSTVIYLTQEKEKLFGHLMILAEPKAGDQSFVLSTPGVVNQESLSHSPLAKSGAPPG